MAAVAVASPPAALWSSSDPMTTIGFGEHTKHGQFDVGNKSLSDVLLVKKLVGVLRDKGYGEHEQRKVANLALANMVDANYTSEDSNDKDSHQISVALADSMLDERILRQKGVYLNSNEPVLLIEVSEKLATDGVLTHVKSSLLDVLRARGIKPVRLYTRLTEKENELEVSALILNVVNTDIGGPSMVQLLDAAFHGEGWKEDLVSKEAWNGYDLLWRDEIHFQEQKSPLPSQDIKEQTEDPLLSPASHPASVSVPEFEEEGQSITGEGHHPIDVRPEPEDEEEDVPPVEHPAMKELRESEAQKVGIQYPTWSREHESHSLLDIIITQSAGVKDSDPVSVIGRSGADDEKDDFEVVEKP